MLKTMEQPQRATPVATRVARPMRSFAVPVAGIVLGALWFSAGFLRDLDLALLCLVTLAGVAAALVAVFHISPRGVWSVASVYLAVYSVFHFGVAPAVGLGLSYSFDMEQALSQWLHTPAAREALVLSLLGLAACLLGIVVVPGTPPAEASFSGNDPETPRLLLIVGLCLTVCCIAAWFFYAIGSRGADLLFGSYAAFLAATADAPLSLVYYGIGLGMTLLAASPPGAWRRFGIGLFVLWTLFALPLGLRGEVLFPTAAALVIEARRRIPLSGRTLIVLVITLLFVIAFVREVRQAGLRGFDPGEIRVTPVDALVEMGGSLRPVAEVVRWHESGDAFLYGASYWAPFERAFYRVIPDLASRRVDASYDERLSNILVQYRVGFIGFSPVAEAYRNGGAVVVVLAMFLVGLTVGWLDCLPATPEAQAVVGVVFVPLLLQIRNSFTSVPFQVLTGALVVMMILVGAWLLRKAR